MKKMIVRLYKENEVMVDENLKEEEAVDVAIGLTKQKLEAAGLKTEGYDIAIITEVV